VVVSSGLAVPYLKILFFRFPLTIELKYKKSYGTLNLLYTVVFVQRVRDLRLPKKMLVDAAVPGDRDGP
jgi:hypothetical protein